MSNRKPDAARWTALSPVLDELLDLAPESRPAHLARLRDTDATLAEDVEALLAQEASLDSQRFMAGPALPPPPGLAGQTLGAYTLERELGRGGMGQVWLARRTDGRYDGQVAIKLLQTGLLGHGDADRFEREGRILARLDQPHIARLIDAGVGDGGRQPYLVLEYVDGLPIDRHVQQHGLSVRQCLQLMADAAEAVAHAHARLILHRDLKPSNMLVRADGQLKLLDFGIAKLLDEPAQGAAGELTQRAGAAFTPSYAAPEQLQGEEVTTATDVYALGVLLYELLGGGHPTAGEATTPLQRLQAAVEHVPLPLSQQVLRAGGPDAARRARALRGDIDLIVAKALKKRPAERYANAAELADDLRRCLAHEPIAARPDHWLYRSRRFVRRHRMGVAAGAVALGAVLAGAAVAVVEARHAQAQREQAEGLLEFMLGDLRQKLQPVGRLDALDAVGERALAYYAAQDAAQLDAGSLGRRARALHLIGEIAERRGQLDEAGRRFAEAARSTAELLARSPADPQRLFDQAQSEYWVAFVERRHGRLAQAEAGFGRYRELVQRLLQTDPAKVAWRLEVAYAEQNLGVLWLEQGRAEQALGALNRARQIFEPLVAAQPKLALELGNNLGWIAWAHEDQGHLEPALLAQQAKEAALGAGDAAGADRNRQYLLALADLDAARLLQGLGRAAPAWQAALRAAGRLDALVALDDSNADWRAARAAAEVTKAELLSARGDRGGAGQALAAALQWWQSPPGAVRESSGRDEVVRLRWWVAKAGLGAVAQDLEDMGRRVDAVLAAAASGQLTTAMRRRYGAEAALALGDALNGAGDVAAAERRWTAALSLAERAATDHHSRTVLAQARWRLGRTQEALTLADNLRSGPYRHPLVLDLFKRVGLPPERKEPA